MDFCSGAGASFVVHGGAGCGDAVYLDFEPAFVFSAYGAIPAINEINKNFRERDELSGFLVCSC
jgi:hypothetical protein